MANLKQAKDIAEQLTKSQSWRSKGGLAVAIASAGISAIPLAGGSLAVIWDKFGETLLNPKLEEKFVNLCSLVSSIEPELDRIDDLEGRISAVSAVLEENRSLMKMLVKILYTATTDPDLFSVSTNHSQQEFSDIVIRDMKVLVEAHNNGRNYFKNVQTFGEDVHFNSTSDGFQRVESSQFTGKTGAAVSMDKLKLEGQVSTINESQGVAGIAFGEGGSIGFGPGGMLGFGQKK